MDDSLHYFSERIMNARVFWYYSSANGIKGLIKAAVLLIRVKKQEVSHALIPSPPFLPAHILLSSTFFCRDIRSLDDAAFLLPVLAKREVGHATDRM